MTTQDHTRQLERYALVAVFLIAILAIVGLVALVVDGPAVPDGVRVVSAQEDAAVYDAEGNLVGDLKSTKSCPGGGRPPCR